MTLLIILIQSIYQMVILYWYLFCLKKLKSLFSFQDFQSFYKQFSLKSGEQSKNSSLLKRANESENDNSNGNDTTESLKQRQHKKLIK